MTRQQLKQRLTEVVREDLPLPGSGNTAARHRRLIEIGQEDLSLAKLAEAHWDALAILAEAGHTPAQGAIYAVWASEFPGSGLHLVTEPTGLHIRGSKAFCSGITFVDRALLTISAPQARLLEIDLNANQGRFDVDLSAWNSEAFRLTDTGTVSFRHAEVAAGSLIGEPGWYIARPGFWQGACGPAACWAGGAAGLLDFASESRRDDPHTRAHLAAMHAGVWAMRSMLNSAADEIDRSPTDVHAAQKLALTLRHLVEQICTDILRRFARAFGPHPLAIHPATSRRYAELDLYLRQSHAERDLEALGSLVKELRDL